MKNSLTTFSPKLPLAKDFERSELVKIANFHDNFLFCVPIVVFRDDKLVWNASYKLYRYATDTILLYSPNHVVGFPLYITFSTAIFTKFLTALNQRKLPFTHTL